MENNQRNSRKRLNSLILLVAFTAVMLIVSTYAWFSAQKTVTLGGLEGKVNVAEGLEISLDAKYWSQEIDFSKYKYQDDTQKSLKKVYAIADSGTTSFNDGNMTAAAEHNIIPSELIPVSTTGNTGDGIGQTDMNMYRGKVTDSVKLTDIIKVLQDTTSNSAYTTETATPAEHDYSGYYAIDFFLRNSSKVDTGEDILQLNSNSVFRLNNTSGYSTGLQNTARVAFALYNSTESTLDEDQTYEDAVQSVNVLANQQQILKATTLGENATGKATIKDVAIWEPNSSDHTQAIVDTYNGRTTAATRLQFSQADTTEYSIADDATAPGTYDYLKLTGASIPTYALSSASVGKTYANLYNWDTDGDNASEDDDTAWVAAYPGLAEQITLKTEKTSESNYAISGGVKNLVSVTSPNTNKYTTGNPENTTTENGVVNFKIPKAQVCRIRMYVWLEGQDVDTINQASHGGGVYLDVGLLKDGEVGQS